MNPAPAAALLERIAGAVVANAAEGRVCSTVGPFVALVDLVSPSPWASLAVPTLRTPVGTDWAAGLPALEAFFAARSRALRFEFLEDLFPTLGPALERAGWPLASRDPVSACRPDDFVPPVPAPGLSLERLDAGSPDDLVELFLGVQHDSFEPGKTGEPSAGEREQLRSRMRLGVLRCLLARLDGVPAGAGSALPAAGLAEVAGIGTLPRFRARGIGSAVTARLAADLFATGTDLAWLTAGSDAAARIYRRLGFRPLGAFQRNHGR
ncbi:MAG: GNAT family N-acetyltransferase [Spirochaetes bacterium]|nr:GNAT family N-acetyltransferase [Spirochaetota bacterium]